MILVNREVAHQMSMSLVYKIVVHYCLERVIDHDTFQLFYYYWSIVCK